MPDVTLDPAPRADLAGLPVYKPGRRSATGFKVSSNESPFPPLPSVLGAIEQAARDINRYPDLAATAVVDAVASRFGIPAAHVVVGCGSVALCTQLVQAFAGAGDEVVFPWRSFEAYPILVQVAGATAVPVALTPSEEHDLDAMITAITDRTRVVFVCNPNNPTGTVVRRGALEAFLDAVPRHVLVVLDEAYHEFVRDPDVPDGLQMYRERPNVAVLRTFSKAYGLAGLRVGYLAAHPAVADAVRVTAVPFAVSGIAQAAAVASLAPAAEHELLVRVEDTVGERARVLAGLRERGWAVPPTEGNFVWLRLGSSTGAFAQACESAGITVRAFDGEGARVTIAEPAANDLLLAVAADFRTPAPPDGRITPPEDTDPGPV